LKKQSINIIIPMAGYGKRLRPHTWSKPKPLVSAAGKSVLGHVLDLVRTVADPEDTEIAFIIGYQGDLVKPYMEQHYPEIKTHYYVQKEMRGQSHAIAMAREQLKGPTLILFVDTIVDEDMSFLRDESAEAVIWVKEVEDPRRFGVVEVGEGGNVKGLIEKPDTTENKLAIVGYYYFACGEDLMAAIDRQLKEDIRTKGEYFIADAMGLMLEDGLKLRPQKVDVWLDAGLPETVLAANRYLLDHGRDNSAEAAQREGVAILQPVFIHPDAEISGSKIGPHVTIGPGCKIADSTIEDSVLEADVQVSGVQLKSSLIGDRAQVHGVAGIINIGDDAIVKEE
jgi:glucose-1-phosphate thymidylyltransferase